MQPCGDPTSALLTWNRTKLPSFLAGSGTTWVPNLVPGEKKKTGLSESRLSVFLEVTVEANFVFPFRAFCVSLNART